MEYERHLSRFSEVAAKFPRIGRTKTRNLAFGKLILVLVSPYHLDSVASNAL